MYLEQPKLPGRLGYEAAGTVEAIGEGVTGFAIGDKGSTNHPRQAAGKSLAAREITPQLLGLLGGTVDEGIVRFAAHGPQTRQASQALHRL